MRLYALSVGVFDLWTLNLPPWGSFNKYYLSTFDKKTKKKTTSLTLSRTPTSPLSLIFFLFPAPRPLHAITTKSMYNRFKILTIESNLDLEPLSSATH
ncbi:hypothetical protein RHMOL_Rhmol06G0024200 [Rhododendron molle]|uniref:Uncharacterized protein n=1 Tax=Rhododendron molle TaxID=49168 RepID=A0ACC0N8B4_RHOML|nr:hypothetical protein RHMOL_Rhmol06G0024200 [Rhododendron molle]